MLSADASKLPAWVGVETEDGGYLVARINALQARDEKVIDAQRVGQQFSAVWSRAEGVAFRAERPQVSLQGQHQGACTGSFRSRWRLVQLIAKAPAIEARCLVLVYTL